MLCCAREAGSSIANEPFGRSLQQAVHRRKRIAGVERHLKVLARTPNKSWPMHFISDEFSDARRLHCLNIVNNFT